MLWSSLQQHHWKHSDFLQALSVKKCTTLKAYWMYVLYFIKCSFNIWALCQFIPKETSHLESRISKFYLILNTLKTLMFTDCKFFNLEVTSALQHWLILPINWFPWYYFVKSSWLLSWSNCEQIQISMLFLLGVREEKSFSLSANSFCDSVMLWTWYLFPMKKQHFLINRFIFSIQYLLLQIKTGFLFCHSYLVKWGCGKKFWWVVCCGSQNSKFRPRKTWTPLHDFFDVAYSW